MLDWDTASKATKVSMLSALGLIALGIVLALVGVNADNKPLMFVALGLLALGVLTHLVATFIRMSATLRRIRENHSGAAKPARKGSK